MAVVKNITQSGAPFANAVKDTVSANTGFTSLEVTFVLTGTPAQLAADWAALLLVTITAATSTISWGGGQL